ncbi:MAG: hypothetical protein P8Y58_01460 [Novosphingobium sp.]|jgi:hypothetical protein
MHSYVMPVFIVLATAAGIGGWILNNWLRMRHGHPIENQWGKAIYPQHDLRRRPGYNC